MFDPISLAITAVGVGLNLFGQSEANKSAKKQAKLAKAAAKQANEFADQQNAIITGQIIPALQKQKGFLQAASDASIRAEKLREGQLTLDAMRMRRDIVRNMAVARGFSLVTSSGQGASLSSSGVFGALAQITGTANRQIQGVNQNEEIGHGIFKANRDVTKATTSANLIGTDINILESQLQTISNKATASGINFSSRIQAAGAAGSAKSSFFTGLGSSILGATPQLTSLGKTAIFGSSQPWYTTPYGAALNNPSNWSTMPDGTMVGPAFNSVG